MPPQYSARLHKTRPKVPNTIRSYRLGVGLTQRQVAALVGIRAATISEWERGLACPTAAPLLRLAKAIDTTAEALYPQFYAHRDQEAANSQVA